MTNTPTSPDDKRLNSKEFETEGDKLRMDMDEAKRKAELERVPRSGSGADLEHHRRVAGQRRRYLGSVGEQEGWQSLSPKLIEAVKTLIAAKHVEEPKGAEPFKGKVHPFIETDDVNSKKKKPMSDKGNTDGK